MINFVGLRIGFNGIWRVGHYWSIPFVEIRVAWGDVNLVIVCFDADSLFFIFCIYTHKLKLLSYLCLGFCDFVKLNLFFWLDLNLIYSEFKYGNLDISTADILELFILECESVCYRFSKGVSLKKYKYPV